MSRSWAVLVAILVPRFASAGSIYLNGVNIDGVTNQQFHNCTVVIDGAGNIFITAKGYAVAPGQPQGTAAPQAPAGGATPTPVPVAPNAAAAPPAAMSQHYWLVTEKAAPGMTQFDIDVFVNSKFVRRFLDDEEHIVLELTKYLQPGQNKVVFVAKKNLGAARRSASPQHYFRIVVGEGDSGGRNVMIHRKLIDYKRTALETKDFTDEFLVVTR